VTIYVDFIMAINTQQSVVIPNTFDMKNQSQRINLDYVWH